MIGKTLEEIFKLDSRIRYVGIYHNGDLYGKMKDGTDHYLTTSETKLSLLQAAKRWAERKDLSSKIGNPIYSMTMYQLVKRITMEISPNLLLFLSTEIPCEHEKLILKLLDFKDTIHKTFN